MSYRNDHDAAMARIDALEAENARLKAETIEPYWRDHPTVNGAWVAPAPNLADDMPRRKFSLDGYGPAILVVGYVAGWLMFGC